MAQTELFVIIEGTPAGILRQDSAGRIYFRYADGYQGTPLSLSLPITNREYGQTLVRPYLFGLLPDSEEQRRPWPPNTAEGRTTRLPYSPTWGWTALVPYSSAVPTSARLPRLRGDDAHIQERRLGYSPALVSQLRTCGALTMPCNRGTVPSLKDVRLFVGCGHWGLSLLAIREGFELDEGLPIVLGHDVLTEGTVPSLRTQESDVSSLG